MTFRYFNLFYKLDLSQTQKYFKSECLILLFCLIFCGSLNLNAQSTELGQPPLPTPSSNDSTSQNATSPANTTINAPGGSPLTPNGNPVNIISTRPNGNSSASAIRVSPKYYEYQSYCRYNEEQLIHLKNGLTGLSSYKDNISKSLKKPWTTQKTLMLTLKDLEALSIENRENADVLLALTHLYFLQFNYTEAKNALYDFLKLKPKEKKQKLIELCSYEVLDASYTEAEAICQQAQKEFKISPLPIIYQGMIFRETLNNKKALQKFEEAEKLKSSEFGATCLGEVSYLEKQYEKALNAFETAIKNDPNSMRAYYGKILTLFEMQKYDEAHQILKQNCRKDSLLTTTYRELYIKLSALKNKKALDYYEGLQLCMKN